MRSIVLFYGIVFLILMSETVTQGDGFSNSFPFLIVPDIARGGVMADLLPERDYSRRATIPTRRAVA